MGLVIQAVRRPSFRSKESHLIAGFQVIYIPAMPETPVNAAYVDRQRECFLRRAPPPDFPQDHGERGFLFVGSEKDIVNAEGRRAMGFPAAA